MRTFRDHGEDFGWFALCRNCDHKRNFSLAYIARHIGLDADVHRVRLRLRCRVCGARDALLYRSYRGRMGEDGPSSFAHLFPAQPPQI